MRSKILLTIGIIINILIWLNSLMPASVSGEQSSIVVNILYPPFQDIFEVNTFTIIIRKLAHFTEYFLLSVVFGLYYLNIHQKKYPLITIIHGLLVAIIDEVIQHFVPGRIGLITDVLIDFSGVIVGICLIFLINLLVLKKTHSLQ